MTLPICTSSTFQPRPQRFSNQLHQTRCCISLAHVKWFFSSKRETRIITIFHWHVILRNLVCKFEGLCNTRKSVMNAITFSQYIKDIKFFVYTAIVFLPCLFSLKKLHFSTVWSCSYPLPLVLNGSFVLPIANLFPSLGLAVLLSPANSLHPL